MYAYMKGKLTYSSPLDIILEVSGIGYRIHIPPSVFGNLPSCEEPLQVYTSFIVRENSQALYGFLSPQDRDLFEALLNVTGVGPKLALSITGHLSIHELQRAIQNHDIPTISRVPGIGKKTAERLIIELRDKIAAILPIDPAAYAIQQQSNPHALTINDAMSALINLGYNQTTAQNAIKKTLSDFPEDVDLATLITNALKNV